MTPLVPNLPPKLLSPRRILIVGEAPGKDETIAHEPFVGYSGQRLNKLLEIAGHSRTSCYLANVSQHRPSATSDNFSLLSWHGEEVQTGLLALKAAVTTYKPNIILLLGNNALRAAKDPLGLAKDRDLPKVSNWRGSIFLCDHAASPFHNVKCISSYHPAYCLRDFDKMPLLMFDIKKAVKHSTHPAWTPPQRTFDIELSSTQLIEKLRHIRKQKLKIAIDIEGGVKGMSCISFATSPQYAFIIPFTYRDGSSCWDAISENQILYEMALTLEDPQVFKILQNGLYDRFVLAYAYGIRVQGCTEDTMVKHWELYSELRKSLATQASIYTEEPYWKFERTELCQGK